MHVPAWKKFNTVMDLKAGDVFRFVANDSRPVTNFMIILRAARGYTYNSVVRLTEDGVVMQCDYHQDEAAHYHLVDIYRG